MQPHPKVSPALLCSMGLLQLSGDYGVRMKERSQMMPWEEAGLHAVCMHPAQIICLGVEFSTRRLTLTSPTFGLHTRVWVRGDPTVQLGLLGASHRFGIAITAAMPAPCWGPPAMGHPCSRLSSARWLELVVSMDFFLSVTACEGIFVCESIAVRMGRGWGSALVYNGQQLPSPVGAPFALLRSRVGCRPFSHGCIEETTGNISKSMGQELRFSFSLH